MAEVVAPPRNRKKAAADDESEEDEEEADPDDVEADLDTILKDRIAAADDEEDEEEVEAADTRGPETPDGVTPKKANEFVCPGCFLLGQPGPVRSGRQHDLPGGRERLPGHHPAPEGQEVAAIEPPWRPDDGDDQPRRSTEEPGRPVVRAVRLCPAGTRPRRPPAAPALHRPRPQPGGAGPGGRALRRRARLDPRRRLHGPERIAAHRGAAGARPGGRRGRPRRRPGRPRRLRGRGHQLRVGGPRCGTRRRTGRCRRRARARRHARRGHPGHPRLRQPVGLAGRAPAGRACPPPSSRRCAATRRPGGVARRSSTRSPS